MSIYIKLNGTNIIGHCDTSHPGVDQGDYDATVNVDRLTNRKGNYKYKYSEGELVELSETEINAHLCVRNKKLNMLRSLRVSKMSESDNESNKHADGDSNAVGTYGQQKAYRKALRDITGNYKDGNGNGTTALDTFALDMNDFDQWPVKPI